MDKLNILIVGLSPEIGGIELFILRILKNIDLDRFHFDILTFCDKCAFEDDFIKMGCQVYHAARRGKNPIKNYFDQKRFFSKHPGKYDFVWFHITSASDIKTIKLTKKYTSAKVICHCHSTDFESRGGLIRKIHLYAHYKNRPQLAAKTDIYLACSKEAATWLFGDMAEEATIIPNGIDIAQYHFDRERRERIRKQLGVDDKIIWGHAGRLTHVKNQAFLIDIFYAFHLTQPNSALLIAGTGELEAALKEKVASLGIASSVIFLGFREDMPDLMQAFDIFILPSLAEGLGIILIEAQASGLPCIISDNVSAEAAVTELVQSVSLEAPVDCWLKKIDQALRQPRTSADYEKSLFNAGFDTQNTINKLETVFLGGTHVKPKKMD